MSLFFREHENKTVIMIFQLSLYNDLLYNKIRTGLKLNVVILSRYCCPFCDNLHHKEITFEEALKEQYLASADCTREIGCICSYATKGI